MKRFITLLLLPLTLMMIWGCGEETTQKPQEQGVKAYILNTIASSISVYDIQTGTLNKDVFQVGQAPNDIKVLNGIAYVVNTMDNSLQMIDLKAQADVGLINIGDGTAPEKIAFADGNKAYVTSNWTNSVKVVDLSLKQVVGSVEVGSMPWGVVVSGNKAFVCNSAAVWDPQKQQTTYGPGTVSVIDITKDERIGTVDVGLNPTEITLDANGNVVVLCTGNYADVTGSLYLIDPTTGEVKKSVDLGTTPGGVALAPNGLIYVTSPQGLLAFESGSLNPVHDLSSPLEEFKGGAGLAFDLEGNGYICVPSWSSPDGKDKLLVMDKDGKLAGSVELGEGLGASLVAIY